MLTIDQIKQVGIPKNVSRLNNRELLGVAIPNESVNLYEAITTVLTELGYLTAPYYKVTEAERDALLNATAGDIVYNTTTNKLNLFTGSS